jgi:hypothetical protein
MLRDVTEKVLLQKRLMRAEPGPRGGQPISKTLSSSIVLRRSCRNLEQVLQS